VTCRSLGEEYDEIAAKLGTSSTNARKLVQIGRRALRRRAPPRTMTPPRLRWGVLARLPPVRSASHTP
jgi:DNA-directed RNA polymerase specialized sigma24 family protein